MTAHQRISKLARGRAAIDLDLHEGYPLVIDAVAARSRAPLRFLRRAWYAGKGEGGSTLIASRLDGTPFAAIPTAPIGPNMIGMRGVPGGYWPFRAPVIAADATRSELAALLAHFGTRQLLAPLWRIGPVYADDPTLSMLIAAARRAGWTVLRRSLGKSWMLRLPTGEGEPWPRKSVERRLRVNTRQLDAIGPVSIAGIHGDRWSEATLATLGRIEAESWVGKNTDGSGAKFLTAEQRAVWTRILADPVLADALHATILSVGDRPVAFTFDMLIDDHQYGIASSYDAAFKAQSPGKLVTYRQFEDSIARGIRTVDLGAGDSGYKRDLGAVPGSEIVDLLLVRSRSAASLLRMKWEGRGTGSDDTLVSDEPWDDEMIAAAAESGAKRDPIGSLEQLLLAGMVAATSIALVE